MIMYFLKGLKKLQEYNDLIMSHKINVYINLTEQNDLKQKVKKKNKSEKNKKKVKPAPPKHQNIKKNQQTNKILKNPQNKKEKKNNSNKKYSIITKNERINDNSSDKVFKYKLELNTKLKNNDMKCDLKNGPVSKKSLSGKNLILTKRIWNIQRKRYQHLSRFIC